MPLLLPEVAGAGHKLQLQAPSGSHPLRQALCRGELVLCAHDELARLGCKVRPGCVEVASAAQRPGAEPACTADSSEEKGRGMQLSLMQGCDPKLVSDLAHPVAG